MKVSEIMAKLEAKYGNEKEYLQKYESFRNHGQT